MSLLRWMIHGGSVKTSCTVPVESGTERSSLFAEISSKSLHPYSRKNCLRNYSSAAKAVLKRETSQACVLYQGLAPRTPRLGLTQSQKNSRVWKASPRNCSPLYFDVARCTSEDAWGAEQLVR